MSVAGDGILERARSTTFALLGTIAAVGLGIVAVAVQQDWPLVGGSPIPGAPKEAGTVHVSRGVALEGATLSLAPRTGSIGARRSASAAPAGRRRGGRGGSGRHGGSSGGPQLVGGSTPVSPRAARPPAPVETTSPPETGAPSPTAAPGPPAGAATTQPSTPSAGKALAKGPSGSGKALAKGPTGSGKSAAHGPSEHGAGSKGKGPAKSYVPSSGKPSAPALPPAPATSPPATAAPGNGVAHGAWSGVQEAAGGNAGSHGHGVGH